MTQPKILICTVGGSHQPILTAIRELNAHFVCFVCSDTDAATGRPGSSVQVTGRGAVIKAKPDDDKPTLSNIPVQAGLEAERYEVRLVPADDLDQVYNVCRQALKDLHGRYPDAAIHADYTGGTKTMTAGLTLAAIEDERVELQLVTGGRVDLIRVRNGYESAAPANIEAIRQQASMRPHLDAWARFAYAEAEAGLRSLPTPRSLVLRAQLNRARDLSAAFAAWDRFDHTGAISRLEHYAGTLPKETASLLGILRGLADGRAAKGPAAQLLDLYRNAERRASQGRYDDAVARLYRLLEWTAQWLLQRHCGVETSNLPQDFAPRIAPNRDGKRQAGLFEAWRLVGEKTSGPMAEFIHLRQAQLLDHLKVRNGSILAHGFEPIRRDAWDSFHQWLESGFIPDLLRETAAVGIRNMPPQLPDRYLASFDQ
ncbi:TIGR02710 family CRISPR-associated CARF protein [Methylococcus sp. Mc7]|uniref:TIGR02710 family CRISPR-associated CARF protein n=1 Tax=Methylococcus sp. Mc7 TaxID=2860258 RepID=UPI001C52D03E|nr:TIGR02710 family CRISPR-associated CARF protein [Methylococcus sp. Mc7]QXP83825.1 TIGR02710 family CRISPR-associated protein [Methylococcus sp. Mc7]